MVYLDVSILMASCVVCYSGAGHPGRSPYGVLMCQALCSAHGDKVCSYNVTHLLCEVTETNTRVDGNKVLVTTFEPDNDRWSSNSLRRRLFILNGSTTFDQACKNCIMHNGQLFIIDRQDYQDAAVDVAKTSGLGSVAISLFRHYLTWLHLNNGQEATFTAWAPGYPKILGGSLGVLGKKYGYLWMSAITADGAICLANGD